jgi:preprotein translocase subunit SecE
VAGKNRGGRSVGDPDGRGDDKFGDDAVDRTDEVEDLDEEFEDEFDDEAMDDDGAFDDEDEADEDADGQPSKTRRRSKVLVSSSAKAKAAARTRDKDEQVGLFRRIPIFIREVFAELQKVIWPTRKELLTYTSVVVVFVAIMMTIVGLLDLGFASALLWVFGSGQ